MTLTDTKKKLLISASVVFVILLIDQIIKIWIKTHFFLGESVHVFGADWFQILFIENYGMAFGMEFAGNYGKIALSIFRLIAICAIGWYIVYLAKKKAGTFLIVTISLIFAGAIGNIIDSAFYGLIFSESTPFDKALLFPDGGGYSTFLHGKVVDMLFFPLFTVELPSWFPFWGSQPFTFFEPVFNIADATITVGVFILLIFQKRLFRFDAAPMETSDNQQPQGK
ncbi:MAG TPA: lipoprotein signal peptidase [Bacteroidales bacterium]|nr:lipoprotein signal peptidase [Bacteroidales bacterium]HQN17152.1 lipoprotein signal peptidase [Bacteroidales bacterium]HQP16709.1 lipoprotein signal peptidase [Bacteroidales bacterium]